MVADVWVRAAREEAASAKARDRAVDALIRIQQAAERIRRVTRIYQDRLEGKRTDDER